MQLAYEIAVTIACASFAATIGFYFREAIRNRKRDAEMIASMKRLREADSTNSIYRPLPVHGFHNGDH